MLPMVGIRPLVIMLPMVGIRPLVIMLPMVGIRPLVIMLDSPQCGRQHEYQLEGPKWGHQMGTECEESTTHWSHPMQFWYHFGLNTILVSFWAQHHFGG